MADSQLRSRQRIRLIICKVGFPGGSEVKNLPVCRRREFSPWVRKRKWHPTPVFLPRKSHGQRSLASYSPRGRKESDTTEQLHSTSLINNILTYFQVLVGQIYIFFEKVSSQVFWLLFDIEFLTYFGHNPLSNILFCKYLLSFHRLPFCFCWFPLLCKSFILM